MYLDATTLKVEVEEFSSLQSEWDELLSKSASGTIFSSWEWQHIWYRAFCTGSGRLIPLVIAIREGGSLVGIAPLVKLGDTLRFSGGTDVSDYLDFIILPGRESQVLSTVLSFLRALDDEDRRDVSARRWTELDLHCLRQHSSSLRLLPELAPALGLSYTCEQEEVCPVIYLPGNWDDYVASLSKKDRHELRRKLRRLEESKRATWYLAAPALDTSEYAEAFLRLARMSTGEKFGFFADRQMQLFFRDIIQLFQPTGVLKLHFLEVDGMRVAVTLSFDQGDERWLYNSGFDPNYSDLSVGLLLKAFCIKDAIAAGKRKFDFLRGHEPYKYDLGGRDTPIYHARLAKRV